MKREDMGLFGLFKKRAPDLRTLGQWLWNNDVTLLDQALENATVFLFKELVESGVIQVEGGPTLLSEKEVGVIAGHLTNLLDGGYLLQGYEPKTTDSRLLSIAPATRDLILRGEYPKISALSVMAGTIIAIRAWYFGRFTECVAVATHVIPIASKKGSGEAYRVRGFARFALGDYDAALADILEAQRREPGLVGITEPLKALRRLTSTPTSGDKEYEPAGLAMNRVALGTLSRILYLGAAAADNTTKGNELVDFGAMAHLANGLLKSKALESPQITMGVVIDLTKCAMSANLALTMYLLTKERPGEGSLPSEQQIRDAFGTCMLFLHGMNSINSNVDPRFSSAIQDLQGEVDSLFASFDKAKFDLA
jgi:hypothetical protein